MSALPIVEQLRRRISIPTGDPELGPLTGAHVNPNGREAAELITELYEALDEARRFMADLDAKLGGNRLSKNIAFAEAALAKARGDQ